MKINLNAQEEPVSRDKKIYAYCYEFVFISLYINSRQLYRLGWDDSSISCKIDGMGFSSISIFSTYKISTNSLFI